MSTQDEAARRVLKAQIEEQLARYSALTGIDPLRLQQGLDDMLILVDRLEPWDMVTPFIDGVTVEAPEIGAVDGLQHGLFYRGFLNMIWGEDGHGKSLLIDQVTWVERHRGHKVMILEAEELSSRTRVARWLEESKDKQFVTAEDVAGVIVYPVSRVLSAENVQMMATQIRNEDVSVVFIDSLGALMANMGLDENKAADVYRVKALVFDPLTEAGAGVVTVDHVTKGGGPRSQSIGSGRKRHILSGVAYEVSADESRWSRNKSGHADLTCWKDRQGWFEPNEHVATMWVAPVTVAGYLRLDVEAPEDMLPDAPTVDNRQETARDMPLDVMVARIVEEAKLIPQTTVTVKTTLKLETKAAAEKVLARARELQVLVWSKADGGYVSIGSRL